MKTNISSLFKNSSIVSLCTLISRILGMIREIMIAYFFGANTATDAFLIANRIPNMFRRIFAEGAFNQAFIPLLTECKNSQHHEAIKAFISHTAGLFLLIVVALVVVVEIFPAQVISMFAPGFTGDTNKMLIAQQMLQITFPYILLIFIVNLTAGILNTYGRFAIPAITYTLFNLSFILCIIYLSPQLTDSYMSLAWAVLIAGILQMLIGIPSLIRLKLISWPKINLQDERIKRLTTLILPAALSASIVQINLTVDNILASTLETGSISWLAYSIHIMELPVALVAISIATVILPHLSHIKSQPSSQAHNAIDWSLKIIFILGIPASIALITLSEAIITSLFQYGSFTTTDVYMAAGSLQAYAAGVLFIMLIRVTLPIFFANQDTKTPFKIAIIAMLVNIVANLILIQYLAHIGLALATSLAAVVQISLIFYYLIKRKWFYFTHAWLGFIAKVIFANAVLACLLILANQPTDFWLASSFITRASYLAALCIAGVIIYFVCLKLLKINLTKLKL
jgi:putative peptidoglycan lipid II flippase